MVLNWMKCVGDAWCKLNAVNLDHSHFNELAGVYMIWHGGSKPHVVYVGQGDIKDRLKAHRKESDIQQYANLELFVTWASVAPEYRDGVEAYLADHWKPKVGSRHPVVNRIQTNSPW